MKCLNYGITLAYLYACRSHSGYHPSIGSYPSSCITCKYYFNESQVQYNKIQDLKKKAYLITGTK